MLEKTSNLFNDKFLLNKFLKSFNVLKLVFIFSYCIRNILVLYHKFIGVLDNINDSFLG